MDKQKISIEFNTTGIVKGIVHISEASNVATAISLSASNIATNELFAMETDGLGFVFPNEKDEAIVTSDMILDWVLRKAFEDFIVGLSQSLIEANRVLKMCTLPQRTFNNPVRSEQEMEKILTKIHDEPTRQSIPDLIKSIEKELGTSLPYKDEILSVNRVRNCLVHRAGIVTDKDAKDASLILSYLDLLMYIQHSGGKIDLLTAEIKKQNLIVERMRFDNVIKSVEFKVGEKIRIDANTFKSVTYTLIEFIHELVKRMPLPNDIKMALIQPMRIQFESKQIEVR